MLLKHKYFTSFDVLFFIWLIIVLQKYLDIAGLQCKKQRPLLMVNTTQIRPTLVSSECSLRKLAVVSVADLKSCTGSMDVVR